MALQQNFINTFHVYDSWGKLDTMGVTYKIGIISAIYKR